MADRVLGELGMRLPGAAEPDPSVVVDPRRYEGVYERLGVTTTVAGDDNGLVATVESTVLGGPAVPQHVRLRAVDDTRFAPDSPPGTRETAWVFLGHHDDERRFRYLHNGRVARRRQS